MATELSRTVGGAVPRSRAHVHTRALAQRLPSGVLLGAFVAAVTALNVLWRTMDTRPPHFDMGHHLSNSVVYLHTFSLAHPLEFLSSYHFYPPLVYWVTDAFYAVGGSQAMWVAVLSNVVWLAILVFATFGTGARLWNARVGWLSVVFVVTAPMIVSSSKEYMLDVPLTAVAALALYLLVRAEGFSNRRYSLLFGVLFGCGLLVKWTLPFVLALPLLHMTALALADARRRRRFNRLLNLAGAATIAVALAGTWYVHNLALIGGSFGYYSGTEHVVGVQPPVPSLASALWYLWNLINQQLYALPFLFVLVGIVFCFRRRELAARNLYPILMAVGTYATFTLLRHKDPRYTLPMLPALAIIATSWLEYLGTRARAWLTGVFVAYGAAAFLAISFGTSLLPKNVTFDLPSTGFGPSEVTVFGQHGYLIGPPSHENWHEAAPFRVIQTAPRSQRRYAYRGPTTIWFNLHGLDYYGLKIRASLVRARSARFLIERDSALASATPPGFTRLRRWSLPDGGTLALYERT